MFAIVLKTESEIEAAAVDCPAQESAPGGTPQESPAAPGDEAEVFVAGEPGKSAADDLGPVIRPLIDGKPDGGSTLAGQLIEPATGTPFARISFAAPADIDDAVDSAARANSLWRGTPFKERARSLRRLASLIYEASGSIARLISREQGKPYVEALNLEVLPALDHLKFMIRHSERYHSGLAVEPRHALYAHKRAHYLYDPIGVVALVTPYPLPFAVPLIQVAAAVCMGNAVVLKPSEKAPLSGLRVGELCIQAGLPSGLVNVIPALAQDTLQLVSHPKVHKAFVTGSLEAGQHIMATAGCAPRPVVLSLGGHHPSIVAGEADVSRAARGVAWGALSNAGQNCGSIQRVYVVERIASRFMEELAAEVDRLEVGNPLEQTVDVGPLITADHREQIHHRVVEAIAGGAQLVRGGVMPDGPGFYYPPTILLDPPADCRLMREETLGPVIPVVVVESLERAILMANDSEYALTASGWSRSPEQADRMMVGLQAGVVTINDVLYSFGEPASTWSGFRKSGMGQSHGTPGLREMSRQKFVSFDPSSAEAPAHGYPYDAEAEEIAQRSIRCLHDESIFSRLAALVALARTRRFRRRVPLRGLFFGSRRAQ